MLPTSSKKIIFNTIAFFVLSLSSNVFAKEGQTTKQEFVHASTDGKCISGNCKDGHGIAIFKSGGKYVGLWRNGKKYGRGTYIWTNGTKYIGDWLDNTRTGQGTILLPNKFKYVGSFLNDKPHGQGTIIGFNGYKYTGEFRNGLRHGNGTTTYAGLKYEGQHFNGHMHGQGKINFADGSQYVGTIHEGKMTGYGTLTNPDGSKYVGNYKKGQRHGKGTFIAVNGIRISGHWRNGEKVGNTNSIASSSAEGDPISRILTGVIITAMALLVVLLLWPRSRAEKEAAREEIERRKEKQEEVRKELEGLTQLGSKPALFSFKVLAGDFITDNPYHKAIVTENTVFLPTKQHLFGLYGKEYNKIEISRLQMLSTDNRRGMANVTGWGIAGAALAGPIGAVGLGALANTKKDWVQFSISFADGKRVLGEIKSKYYTQFEFHMSPFISDAA